MITRKFVPTNFPEVKYKKNVVPMLLLPWCQRKYRDPAFSVVHGDSAFSKNNPSNVGNY